MTHVPASLALTAYVAGYLLCIAVAVDVITRHPYDWMRAGSTQRFRIFLIFAPLVAIGFIPLGIATSIFYLGKVRPRLIHDAMVVAGQGWPPVARKPILGLNWAWRELHTSQKVKTILSAAGATFLIIVISRFSPAGNASTPWTTYAIGAFLWPTLFLAMYLALGFFNLYLKSFPQNTKKSPASMRTEALAKREYDRRVAEFHARNSPRTPWGQ